jgi:hypothetical protein
VPTSPEHCQGPFLPLFPLLFFKEKKKVQKHAKAGFELILALNSADFDAFSLCMT